MKLFANLSQKLLPAAFMTLKKSQPHRRQPDARRESPSLPQPHPRNMATAHHASSQAQPFSRTITTFPPTLEQPPNPSRPGTTSYMTPNRVHDIEADSLRSRASSVVSTGTRFSVSTLPLDEPSHIEGLLGRFNHASAFRPRSVMSTGSYDQPAPPYESRLTNEALSPPVTQQDCRTSMPSSVVQDDQSPTNSPENSLTEHYSRVVRTIDQNHSNQMRRLKEAHQEELGATRNAIDQTYRKELKAKAREVEKMREEMASLVADHEAYVARLQREALIQTNDQANSHAIAMEKACNTIEDTWEARWSDWMQLSKEEVRKATLEFQMKYDAIMAEKNQALEEKRKVVEERDKIWIREILRTHPDLDHEVHAILESINNDLERSDQGGSSDSIDPMP